VEKTEQRMRCRGWGGGEIHRVLFHLTGGESPRAGAFSGPKKGKGKGKRSRCVGKERDRFFRGKEGLQNRGAARGTVSGIHRGEADLHLKQEHFQGQLSNNKEGARKGKGQQAVEPGQIK